MKKEEYAILFAPDGKHFQISKKGSLKRIGNEFSTGKDIKEHIALNPFAKIRFVNLTTNKVIAELSGIRGEVKMNESCKRCFKNRLLGSVGECECMCHRKRRRCNPKQ